MKYKTKQIIFMSSALVCLAFFVAMLIMVKVGYNFKIDGLNSYFYNPQSNFVTTFFKIFKAFIKKFILASGSLKEMAAQYGVTYPTVRLRLDRLIQKIKLSEDTEKEPYIALIKQLALNDKLDFETAKLLIAEYKKAKGGT